MYDYSKTAISKIQAIIIISILLFSITISVLAWNHVSIDTQGNSVEPHFPRKELNSQHSNGDPEISNGDRLELQELEELVEPEQPPETEPEILTEVPTEPKQDEDPSNGPPCTEPDMSKMAQIRIGDEDYLIDPTNVETTIPDLFKAGQF